MDNRVQSFRSFVSTVAPPRKPEQIPAQPDTEKKSGPRTIPPNVRRSSSIYSRAVDAPITEDSSEWRNADQALEPLPSSTASTEPLSLLVDSPMVSPPRKLRDQVPFLEPRTYTPLPVFHPMGSSGPGSVSVRYPKDQMASPKSSWLGPSSYQQRVEEIETLDRQRGATRTVKSQEKWRRDIHVPPPGVEDFSDISHSGIFGGTGERAWSRIQPLESSGLKSEPPQHIYGIQAELMPRDLAPKHGTYESSASSSVPRGRSRKRQLPPRKRQSQRYVRAGRRPRRSLRKEQAARASDYLKAERKNAIEDLEHQIAQDVREPKDQADQPSVSGNNQAFNNFPEGQTSPLQGKSDIEAERPGIGLVPLPLFWGKSLPSRPKGKGYPRDKPMESEGGYEGVESMQNSDEPKRFPSTRELPLKMTLPADTWRDMSNGVSDEGADGPSLESEQSSLQSSLYERRLQRQDLKNHKSPKLSLETFAPEPSISSQKRQRSARVRSKTSAFYPRARSRIPSDKERQLKLQRKVDSPNAPSLRAAEAGQSSYTPPEIVPLEKPRLLHENRGVATPGHSPSPGQKRNRNLSDRGVGAWWRSTESAERSRSEPTISIMQQNQADRYGTLSPYQFDSGWDKYPRSMEQAPSPRTVAEAEPKEQALSPTRRVATRLLANVHDALDKARASSPFWSALPTPSQHRANSTSGMSSRSGPGTDGASLSPLSAGKRIKVDEKTQPERLSFLTVASEARMRYKRANRVKQLKREIHVIGPTDPSLLGQAVSPKSPERQVSWF